MLAPAGAPHPSALLAATALLALLAPAGVTADDIRAERIRAIQTGLPRYDPAIREKDLAAKAATAGAEKKRPAVAETTTANNGTAAAPGSDVIELPRITVHPLYLAPKPLPRLTVPKPLRDLKGEPFESGSARDARLIKKHLSVAAQAVNRLLGNSLVGLARAAEEREKDARQLNEIADAVEVDEAIGRDPALVKKVRDEYLRLYYAGPK